MIKLLQALLRNSDCIDSPPSEHTKKLRKPQKPIQITRVTQVSHPYYCGCVDPGWPVYLIWL
jgi:hypothetical protein